MKSGRLVLFMGGFVWLALLLTGCPQSNPVGPTAAFSVDNASGIAPLTVQFTDQSIAGDSPIMAWAWSFGDGTTSTEASPAHTYAVYGTYTVSLTVLTSVGTDVEEKQGYITVSPQNGVEELVYLPDNVPMTMVWIPSGSCLMGCYANEGSSTENEVPQHTVAVPGFWMGKYEITKRQWQALMNTTPWSGQLEISTDLDSPAVYISWNDAQAFITALNTFNGGSFRLPSEAEWEYACRAGTTTRYYWGEDLTYTLIGDYTWSWVNGGGYAHGVGLKLPNAWGLYDLAGNAAEFCQDTWHDNYTGAPTNGSAWISDTVSSPRVIRGGGFGSTVNNCRSAARLSIEITTFNSASGFRLVRP